MGGFFDGILLYQVLQWHHPSSLVAKPGAAEYPRANTGRRLVPWLAPGCFNWLARSQGTGQWYRERSCLLLAPVRSEHRLHGFTLFVLRRVVWRPKRRHQLGGPQFPKHDEEFFGLAAGIPVLGNHDHDLLSQ